MPALSPPGAFPVKTLVPERCCIEATRLWESSLTCLSLSVPRYICIYVPQAHAQKASQARSRSAALRELAQQRGARGSVTPGVAESITSARGISRCASNVSGFEDQAQRLLWMERSVCWLGHCCPIAPAACRAALALVGSISLRSDCALCCGT